MALDGAQSEFSMCLDVVWSGANANAVSPYVVDYVVVGGGDHAGM